MDGLRSYLLGIFAAAVLCGIVTRFLGEKGTQGAIVKMIAGVFLTFTVIRPVVNIRLEDFCDFTDDFSYDASLAAGAGEALTKEALSAGIKSRCETYILDKAAALNARLTVEITLTDQNIPIPCKVRLKGNISPYAKSQLQTIIADELGIDKEHQIWT